MATSIKGIVWGDCQIGNSIHAYYFKRQEHIHVFHEYLNALEKKKKRHCSQEQIPSISLNLLTTDQQKF